MSSSLRSLLLLHPRPLRSLAPAARRAAYATIPTKNPNPTVPIEPSREQAMPIGSFYEAILNTPQPIPDVKPEEPASSVKEHLQQEEEGGADEAAAAAGKEPAKRGRKPKPVKEAATAAAKTSVSSSSSSSPPAAAAAADRSTAPPVPTPPPTEASTQDKAKVIFGSRLAGPAERAERLAQIRARSSVVAGVLVPPRPEEPDNCCMSGCVNCVWDRFRDEMEAWVVASAEAERRKAEGEVEGTSSGGRSTERAQGRDGGSQGDVSAGTGAATTGREATRPVLDHTTVSMDDDGGGSETNWNGAAGASTEKIARDLWDEELYKNVPVGIREFMKQEKKLKEKHLREGTAGG